MSTFLISVFRRIVALWVASDRWLSLAARKQRQRFVDWLRTQGVEWDYIETPTTQARAAAQSRADRLREDALLAELYALRLSAQVAQSVVDVAVLGTKGRAKLTRIR